MGAIHGDLTPQATAAQDRAYYEANPGRAVDRIVELERELAFVKTERDGLSRAIFQRENELREARAAYHRRGEK
jgi:hypothetical protein